MTDKLFAYLQLVRLPNVFTALADVAMGFFVTQGIVELASLEPVQIVRLTLLCVASACLYLAGMALNDAFDADIDREERPERPIPSGRVSLSGARTGIWSVGGGSVRGCFAFDERGGLSAGPGGRWAGDCGRRLRCRHQAHANWPVGDGTLPISECHVGNEPFAHALADVELCRRRRNWTLYRGSDVVCARRRGRAIEWRCSWRRWLARRGLYCWFYFRDMRRGKDLSSRRFRTTRAGGICSGLCWER